MIDFIEGTVESKAPGELVISAGGVGFLLLCSNATLAEAPAKGEKWRCYSVLNVREDAMELFGFASRQERAMFKKLCQVTGVGAKTALGVLSALPVRELSVAIVTGDIAALSRAPGIGKKTAQRIVLELRDKMSKEQLEGASAASPVAAADLSGGVNHTQEAVAALMVLGYTQAEALHAMKQIDTAGMEADEIIRQCLKKLVKQ